MFPTVWIRLARAIRLPCGAQIQLGETSVIFHKTFSTKPESSLAVLSEIKRVAGQNCATAETIADIEIILNEVVNNIAEHAYLQQPDKPIWIWVYRNKNGFGFHLVDKGRAMPQAEIPTVPRHDLSCSPTLYPEGGFGLQLVRMLALNLRYKRDDRENHFSFDVVNESQ